MRRPFERKKPETYIGKTYGFARVVRFHHDDPDRLFSYFFECECLKCGKRFILNQQGLNYRLRGCPACALEAKRALDRKGGKPRTNKGNAKWSAIPLTRPMTENELLEALPWSKSGLD